MPELPEVETVARQLATALAFETKVERVKVYSDWKRLPWDLRERCYKQRIRHVKRHGKLLFLEFETPLALAIRLGMSGSFRTTPRRKKHKKHDHFALVLGNGTKIIYNDPRKFGRIRWVNKKGLATLWNKSRTMPEYNMGVDALDERLSPDNIECTRLWQISVYEKFLPLTPIKSALLKQNGIAGIGNIYASEILAACHIHPAIRLSDLTQSQKKRIAKHTWKILHRAIKCGGTTISGANKYQNVDQEFGRYSKYLAVYGQAGKPCQVCDTRIKQFRMEQRSTFYCPKCQSE